MTAPFLQPSTKRFKPPISVGAGLTHTGCVRERNEDAILTDPTGALWAVADGMGGYGHGDVASDAVIERLSTAPDGGNPGKILVDLLKEANRLVHAEAHRVGAEMIGATVVALMVENAIGYVAWAGDSRAYLLRNGGLRMLTRDHTVVQDLLDRGVIAAEDAHGHAKAHIVTRAVGGASELDVDLVTTPFTVGDRILLCSDGLTACVGDQRIAQLLAQAETPEAACHELMTEALEAGAPDNVSVVVVFIVEP